MNKIRELLGKPIATLVIGFIVGVIIGLPVLGWGLFPVQWTNAAPNDLRQDLKQDWMRMSIDLTYATMIKSWLHLVIKRSGRMRPMFSAHWDRIQK